jgi:hypothetical protein
MLARGTQQDESKSVGVVADVVTPQAKGFSVVTTSCPLMFGRGLVGASGWRSRAEYGVPCHQAKLSLFNCSS